MNKKLLILSLLSLLVLPGCSKEDNKDYKGETLVIYNVEDYISNGDDDSVDLIAKFEKQTGCEVKYYTYDTNETMYNQFKLQKEGTYDLVLGSEYIIQKMAKEGLLDTFDNYQESIPNYYNNVSSILRNKLKNMEIVVDGETTNLDKYAVGYMWGTLGIVYDPNCSDTIREDVKSWDIFYDEQYKDKVSIKNSMRDAYDVGLMHGFSKTEEYQVQLNKYLEYLEYGDENKAKEFSEYLQSVFDFNLDLSEEADASNQAKIELVKEELIKLKQNIFGFETDSGKNDIVEGSKIKMDLAYSGDAVYSIQTALDDADKVLEYFVPLEGGNIWYDAWMLPKGCKHKDLAYEFLNFISDSNNAASNADYIGYTPFIVGDEMFTTIASWYGASEFDINQSYCEDTYVIKDNILYICIKDSDGGIDVDNEEYFSYEEYDSEYQYEEGDMVSYRGILYNCVEDGSTIENFEEVVAYDISHIYGDSLTSRNAVIYPFYGSENILETQYPSKEVIYRCAVMNDYGVYLDNVVIMWGQIKAYADMTPTYIFLITTVAACMGIFVFSLISKTQSIRYKRKKGKL